MKSLLVFLFLGMSFLFLAVSFYKTNDEPAYIPTTLSEAYGDNFTIQKDLTLPSEFLSSQGSGGIWTSGPSLPSPRYYGTSETIKKGDSSVCYLFGGDTTGSGVASRSVFIFSFLDNTLSQGPPMSSPHRLGSAANLGDTDIFVYGGFTNGNPDPLNTIQALDLNTNTWHTAPETLPTGLFFSRAEKESDTSIVIIGGVKTGDIFSRSILRHTPHRHSVEEIGMLPQGIADGGFSLSHTARITTQGHYLGGFTSNTQIIDDAFRVNINGNVIVTTLPDLLPQPLGRFKSFGSPATESIFIPGGSTSGTGFVPTTNFNQLLADKSLLQLPNLPLAICANYGGFSERIIQRSPSLIEVKVFVGGGITTGPALNGQAYIYIDTINFVGINNISSEIPAGFKLYQNFPNPFNPSTVIKFDLQKSEEVTLSIFDISGKNVQTLIKKKLNAGTYEYSYNGKSLTSGVYFYRILTESYSETRKMMLIK